MKAEYKGLLAQLRMLSKELLPPKSPTASYTQEEVLRTLAFRLSAHAEIEGFIEYCADFLVTHLAAKNKINALSKRTQRTLLLHGELCKKYPPASLGFRLPPDAKKKIEGVLNTVLSFISSNNGVSEKDLLKLFVPLGVDLSFFTEQWLNSMNALSRARGEAAHNSWLSANAVYQPDPVEERRRLVLPLLGIRDLITEIDRLRSLA